MKRNFDPKSKADIKEFRYYLQNNRWEKGCPFNVEWPYVSIPDMIKDKIARSVCL